MPESACLDPAAPQSFHQNYQNELLAGVSPGPIKSECKRFAAMKEPLFLLLIKMSKLSPRLFSFHSFLLSALVLAFNMLKSYCGMRKIH